MHAKVALEQALTGFGRAFIVSDMTQMKNQYSQEQLVKEFAVFGSTMDPLISNLLHEVNKLTALHSVHMGFKK